MAPFRNQLQAPSSFRISVKGEAPSSGNGPWLVDGWQSIGRILTRRPVLSQVVNQSIPPLEHKAGTRPGTFLNEAGRSAGGEKQQPARAIRTCTVREPRGEGRRAHCF